MNELISMVKEKKDDIKRQRIERGMEEKFSKLPTKEYPIAKANATIVAKPQAVMNPT
jgi:hypothetical protein